MGAHGTYARPLPFPSSWGGLRENPSRVNPARSWRWPLTCAPAAGTAPAWPLPPAPPPSRPDRMSQSWGPAVRTPFLGLRTAREEGGDRRILPAIQRNYNSQDARGAAGRIAPRRCPRQATVAAGGGGCQAVTAGGTRPGCCCCCCCRDAAGAAAASQADPARPWTSKRGPVSSSATITIIMPSCCRRRRAGRGWSRARRRQRRPRRRQQEAAEEGESQPPEPPRRSRRPGLNTACRASCISCSTSGAASRRSAPSGRRSGRSCR